jgi:hypothetical protein
VIELARGQDSRHELNLTRYDVVNAEECLIPAPARDHPGGQG